MSGFNSFLTREVVSETFPDPEEAAIESEAIPSYSPSQLKALLDLYIVGQDHAKKVLAVATFNRACRQVHNSRHDNEVDKSNVLLIGPTGCGKTFLVTKLAKLINVPVLHYDVSRLSSTGYVGDDISDILDGLYDKVVEVLRPFPADAADQITWAQEFKVAAENSIIYLDEIDKIAGRGGHSTFNRDVSGSGVQENLLRFIEGDVHRISKSGSHVFSHPAIYTVVKEVMPNFNSKDVLFIGSGAFPGLAAIAQKRLNPTGVGFHAIVDKDDNIKSEYIVAEDLITYGFMPEFVGRFSGKAALTQLTKEDLIRILIDTEWSLTAQYGALVSIYGKTFEFTAGALAIIAEKALSLKTGARALRSILDNTLLDLYYRLPDTSETYEVVSITEDMIKDG